ncbi:unnamed protein product [Sphagnum troendelagicum]|uniref:Uncharacterized protein n=1 Tax=Sphagnum troendelagicum TaxID=128251 RepID=A0ABP0UCK7_9BRYO
MHSDTINSHGQLLPSYVKKTNFFRSLLWLSLKGFLQSFQVGLHKILSLLESEDVHVHMHPVVLANLDLAAEEANQEKVVEARGLGSLLKSVAKF